jgi:hypothetical protein
MTPEATAISPISTQTERLPPSAWTPATRHPSRCSPSWPAWRHWRLRPLHPPHRQKRREGRPRPFAAERCVRYRNRSDMWTGDFGSPRHPATRPRKRWQFRLPTRDGRTLAEPARQGRQLMRGRAGGQSGCRNSQPGHPRRQAEGPVRKSLLRTVRDAIITDGKPLMPAPGMALETCVSRVSLRDQLIAAGWFTEAHISDEGKPSSKQNQSRTSEAGDLLSKQTRKNSKPSVCEGGNCRFR